MTVVVPVGLTCEWCLKGRHFRCAGCACRSCGRGLSSGVSPPVVDRPKLVTVQTQQPKPKDPPERRLVVALEVLEDEMAEGPPLFEAEPAVERPLPELLRRHMLQNARLGWDDNAARFLLGLSAAGTIDTTVGDG